MVLKYIFILLVAIVVNSQCASIEEEVRNSTKFTIDWYRSSFNASTNLVVSPISFRILLSLLYHSAVNETEHELQEYVYFSGKEETAVSQLLTLNKLLINPHLKVVNRVYIKEGFELKPSLHEKALQYHSAFEHKDFMKSQQTANEINQFVEEQTNGLIKDLVSADIFDEDTRVLLLNTLYFKADWASQFKKESVHKRDFHGFDDHTYSIDFMNKEQLSYLHHSTALKAWTLKLDYVPEANSRFIIILPDEDSSISQVMFKLNSVTFNEVVSDTARLYKRIFLPVFEIESEIEGAKELQKLDLKSMFKEPHIEALTNGPNLVVDDAKQKAKIIVNTKGTEAAAASYIELAVPVSAIVGPPVQNFYVDRPFIYLIVTADTSEPLFIGHYSQPSHSFLVN